MEYESTFPLVEVMLELHKRLAAARSDADRKIDALVYVLYGLTAEEIKIVEEGC